MTDTPPDGDRIAKIIARSGRASRREAERLIEQGRVTVNGKQIDSPALNVTPRDVITVDDKPLQAAEPPRIWLYHKPTGLVTTNSDEKGRETIFDRLPQDMPRVMSVGRLDLNSEGLLLLTNDGEVKRKLELPSTGWLRKYRVRVNGRISEANLETLRGGLTYEGITYQPMSVTLDRQQGANAWLTVGLREGKNREIRRAMEAIGVTVNRLIRVSYGPFQLGQLKPGEVEELRRKVVRDQLGLDDESMAALEDEALDKPKPGLRRKPRKSQFGGPGQPGRPQPAEPSSGRGPGKPGRRGADKPDDRPAGKPGDRPLGRGAGKPANAGTGRTRRDKAPDLSTRPGGDDRPARGAKPGGPRRPQGEKPPSRRK